MKMLHNLEYMKMNEGEKCNGHCYDNRICFCSFFQVKSGYKSNWNNYIRSELLTALAK